MDSSDDSVDEDAHRILGRGLLEAARTGDHKRMEILFEACADPTDITEICKDPLGNTALMTAVENEHMKCTEQLLSAGARVNAMNRDRVTALLHAASHGNVDCVKMLLDHGACVNHCNSYGNTALIKVAGGGHKACLEVLIENGALVNLPNFAGQTAVLWALSAGQMDCVKVLLDNNAEIDASLKGVDVTVEVMSDCGHVDGLRLVLDSVTVKQETLDDSLLIASASGKYDCVKLLLDHGANVNFMSHVNTTPLGLAARNISRINTTALGLAARKGHHDCLELLIAAGALVNLTGHHADSTKSPLVEAIRGPHYNSGRSGDSPPCVEPHLKCVKSLLRAGAVAHNIFLPNVMVIVSAGEVGDTILKWLFAAGMPVTFLVPECLKKYTDSDKELEEDLQLQYLCKKYIRQHLVRIHPQSNLFITLDKLQGYLPQAVIEFLLYGVKLE